MIAPWFSIAHRNQNQSWRPCPTTQHFLQIKSLNHVFGLECLEPKIWRGSQKAHNPSSLHWPITALTKRRNNSTDVMKVGYLKKPGAACSPMITLQYWWCPSPGSSDHQVDKMCYDRQSSRSLIVVILFEQTPICSVLRILSIASLVKGCAFWSWICCFRFVPTLWCTTFWSASNPIAANPLSHPSQ